MKRIREKHGITARWEVRCGLATALGVIVTLLVLPGNAQAAKFKHDAKAWCADYRHSHPGIQCKAIKARKACPAGFQVGRSFGGAVNSKSFKSCIPTAAVSQRPGSVVARPAIPITVPVLPVATPRIGTAKVCAFGSPDCNVCANHVVKQFLRLGYYPGAGKHGKSERGASARLKFRTNRGVDLPPSGQSYHGFSVHNHMEGIVRIPSSTGVPWFVLTKAMGSHDSGILMLQMAKMSAHRGEKLVNGFAGNHEQSPDSTGGVVSYFKQISGTRHTGGAQMLGQKLVAVPSECFGKNCNNSWVDFFDVTNRRNPRSVSKVPLGGGKGHYVSAARLSDGKTLLLVNEDDAGHFDIFTNPGSPLTTRSPWRHVGRGMQDFSEFANQGWHVTGKTKHPFTYQNASLVTECGTGDLFFVALRQRRPGNVQKQKWESHNEMNLFKVNVEQDRSGSVKRLDLTRPSASSSLTTPVSSLRNDKGAMAVNFHSQGGCKMRGAASVYVTPSHKMVVYCGGHTGNNAKMSMGEITGPR